MADVPKPDGRAPNPSSGHVASSGVRWMTGSQLVSQVVNTAMNLALAWLLTSGEIGLMAVATIVIALVDELTNLGTGQAVIQQQDLSRRTLDAVFSLNALIGCALALVIFALSGPLAVLAGGNDAAGASALLKILAFSVAAKSLAIVHLALLRRTLRFRAVGIILTVGLIGQVGVTLGCALAGVGPASMAYGSLTASLLVLAAALGSARQAVTLRLNGRDLAPVFGFSANLTMSNLFGFLTANVDRSLVAHMLGIPAAGVYQLGVRILRTPIVTLTSTVNEVLMPVLARIQHDRDEQSRRFLQATAGVALAVGPAMSGLAIISDHLVAVVLSPEWSAAGSVIGWMALVGMMRAIGGLIGPLVTANGRTGVQLGLNVLIGVVLIASYIVTTRISLDAVVIGILIVHLVVVPIQIWVVLRMIGTPWRAYLGAVGPGLGIAVLTSFAASGAEWLLQDSTSDVVTLVVSVVAGLTAGIVAMITLRPAGFHELAVIAGRGPRRT